MMYVGIVVLGSSTFKMSEAIVCVICFGRVFGEQNGCFVSCLQVSWTMVGTRVASGGMSSVGWCHGVWCLMVAILVGGCYYGGENIGCNLGMCLGVDV